MLEAHFKDQGVSFISRVEFHQLQIPVSLKYSPLHNLSIHTGICLGAQIATRYKFVRYSLPATPLDLYKKLDKELAKETKSNLTPFSFGILAGTAYNITRRFGLTARYITPSPICLRKRKKVSGCISYRLA